ncbi:YbaN family protein [Mycoplasmatota bacterium]|nr:YbaN family protein [Mycoplasmatota bacterium]
MKIIYISLGTLFLALGVLGIILPILPTVPFLLLTTYFYSKSSNKFYTWFIKTKIYKNYLEDFVESRTMTRKNKWQLMIFVDSILLLSFILVDFLPAKILIILLFLIKHYYFYKYVQVV